jgi:hypothetical protein
MTYTCAKGQTMIWRLCFAYGPRRCSIEPFLFVKSNGAAYVLQDSIPLGYRCRTHVLRCGPRFRVLGIEARYVAQARFTTNVPLAEKLSWNASYLLRTAISAVHNGMWCAIVSRRWKGSGFSSGTSSAELLCLAADLQARREMFRHSLALCLALKKARRPAILLCPHDHPQPCRHASH